MPQAYQLRQEATERMVAAETDRTRWDPHWKAIAQVMLPRNGRFTPSDYGATGRRNAGILDATASYSIQVGASGLMAGATSPGRPWFALQCPDPELQKNQMVREWVDSVTEIMRSAIARARSIYRSLPSIYTELLTFGTGAAFCRSVDDDLLHLYPMTVGEYSLGLSDRGAVDSCYRRFDMTVGQIVSMFGIDNVSIDVKLAYERGNRGDRRTVCHAIEPRLQRNPFRDDARNKAWRSLWWEAGSSPELILDESGYSRFPVLAPRWRSMPQEPYGDCPGMMVLDATEQLQHQQWRKGQAIDYQTQPPVEAPTAFQNREVSMLPGAVNIGSDMSGNAIRPIVESRLNLRDLAEDMAEVRSRIREGFFVDLFLMLASSDRRQMTAAEVAERHEEKLLMLGPVLENLHDELLRPLIDLVFYRLAETGQLPPPPPELAGMELQVEFVSMLAQAQRAIGANAQDRLLVTAQTLAGMGKSEVLDRLDGDEIIESYATMLGTPAKLLVPREEAQAIREARNRAYAAKEQLAAIQGGAKAGYDLSRAQTQQPSLLDTIASPAGEAVA